MPVELAAGSVSREELAGCERASPRRGRRLRREQRSRVAENAMGTGRQRGDGAAESARRCRPQQPAGPSIGGRSSGRDAERRPRCGRFRRHPEPEAEGRERETRCCRRSKMRQKTWRDAQPQSPAESRAPRTVDLVAQPCSGTQRRESGWRPLSEREQPLCAARREADRLTEEARARRSRGRARRSSGTRMQRRSQPGSAREGPEGLKPLARRPGGITSNACARGLLRSRSRPIRVA